MESKLVLHTKTRHINVYAHPENVTHLTKEKMGALNLQGGTAAYVKQFIDEHNQDESAHPYIQESISTLEGTVTEHIEDTSNPHSVTKEQVGLGNVDNTADLDKPISTATQAALDGKQDAISDLGTIRSGAALGATAVQPGDLATVATTGSYNDLTNKPTIPSQASDVHALPDTTKYGASIDLDINSSTYVVTAQLKDQDGNALGTAQTIDLPLESVVVNGSYDSANKKVVLTLQNGSTIDFSVADLVAGLQSEITSSNKLSADLVDDTNTAHKFVTASEKSTWNGKQDAISDLATIRSNASAGANAATTIAGYGDIVSHDASEFALDSNAVHKTGDETIAGIKTFTTKISAPIIENGETSTNYFQTRKFRGQGDANDYRHAIDFGYDHHDQVDFYEYGGKWVFHKHTSAAQGSGDTVVGQILSTGWNGPVVGNVTGTASKATADADGNEIKTNYIKNESILLDLSAHSTVKPKRIWQEKLDDCMYRAESRFTVTGSNFTSNSFQLLFDGNADTHLDIADGETAVLSISGNNNLGLGYPYGYIYCTFYAGSGPQDISDVTCRVYQNWSGHNVGWVTLTGEEVASTTIGEIKCINTLRFPTQNYAINQIEITFDNTDGTSATEGPSMKVCAVHFFCNRTGVHSLPLLTKWGGDTVYGNITIPTANGSFVGNLTGNASTATKATQDGDGNTISSTYLKLSGGTMTGDLNFAGANNRIAGFTLTENGNNVDGGWNWANKDGAGFYLRSSSHSAAGQFGFFARNSAGTTKKLIGNVNGSLTWADSEVQRAIHKGVANGIASLDANTKIPVAQLPVMTGATSSAAGTVGAVPAPAAGDEVKFLRGDGTWVGSTSTAVWGSLTGTLSDQTDLQTALNAKQATISDLATIRSGASAGATAVQPADLQTAINSVKRNIGEIVPSLLPLTDASLHLLDGALISGSGMYSAFVTYIAGLVSSYPNLFVTENAWQTSVTTYGVCGKFVYDSTNNTVRLPKITGIMEGTIDATALGDLVQAGLPNITGSATTYLMNEYPTFAGALASGSYVGAWQTITGSNPGILDRRGLILDASNSSSVYGNSNTVQPQTIKGFYYIVVANSTKTEIEADIDQIATDLNLKAGTDLSNLNATGEAHFANPSLSNIDSDGKEYMRQAPLPSDTYTILSLAASGSTYTMTDDGWLSIVISGGNAYAEIVSWKDSIDPGFLASTSCFTNNTGWGRCFLPVKKGDKVNVYYGGSNFTNRGFKFTPSMRTQS